MTRVLERGTALRAEETRAGCWTREYSLRHCEGYMVDGSEGPLGFVSAVADRGESLELVVDGVSGELHVPLEAIRYFDPSRERIVVSRPAR